MWVLPGSPLTAVAAGACGGIETQTRDSVVWFSLKQKGVIWAIFLRSAGLLQEKWRELGSVPCRGDGPHCQNLSCTLKRDLKEPRDQHRGGFGKGIARDQRGEALAFFLCISNLSFLCWYQYEVNFILYLIWWSKSFQLFKTLFSFV